MKNGVDHKTGVPIVVQLRLIFVIILLVIGFVVMHSLWQFQGWKVAQERVARISVPTVLLSQEHIRTLDEFVARSNEEALVSPGETSSSDPTSLRKLLIEMQIQAFEMRRLNAHSDLTKSIDDQLRSLGDLDEYLQAAKSVDEVKAIIHRDTSPGGLGDVSEHPNLGASLKKTAKRINQRAKVKLEVDTAQVEAEANGFFILFSLSSIAGMFVIAFLASRLVEHRINRRVSRLTHLVLEIAEGRLDQDIDLSGKDEIGRMARALEVFKENAIELRRSNNELEKFAYVAAHDLRSPLRAVQDLASWTIEDPGNQLSDDSREYLHLLMARVRRLAKLLADLLEYSRIGQEAASLSPTALDETARSLVEMVDVDGQFTLEYSGTTDTITTYQTPLKQVLLNLISNAIMHHDRKQGTLKVRGTRVNGRIRLSIEDDGPGIPKAYHDKIFDLFQTLKSRDVVEGSGLGLSIVSKLITHYGGHLELISDPDVARGTTFVFDFPDAGIVPEAGTVP